MQTDYKCSYWGCGDEASGGVAATPHGAIYGACHQHSFGPTGELPAGWKWVWEPQVSMIGGAL